MKVKVSEATGSVLNYLVAKCEGSTFAGEYPHLLASGFRPPRYSTDWSQGGPIVEREGMHVDCLRVADHYRPAIWEAWPYATGTKHIQQGPKPLIAAMRCYVASKLGDEMEVPDELMEAK